MGRVDVLLGLQWGDEGKGKIVDVLTPRYDMVARFQGGPNAGHTLEFAGEKYVLRSVPSGIFQGDKINIIGNGVVLDPVLFREEVESLFNSGHPLKDRLVISRKAHLILPTHRLLDAAGEKALGAQKVGTTGKGIGPTYTDKVSRHGVRVGDIEGDFEANYKRAKERHLGMLRGMGVEVPDLTQAEADFFAAVEYLRQFRFVDSEFVINNTLKSGKNILAEGAQGSMLDIDFGSYPFVTSSNTICAGSCVGLGVSPRAIGDVYGIFKAYCTRVGAGPFPTELFDEDGRQMAERGYEFGAVTGRPRRCGWIDLVALRYTIMLNGVTKLIMMKSDVLDTFATIKACRAYRINGVETRDFPYSIEQEIEPIYDEIPGWQCDLTAFDREEQLPKAFLDYVAYLERELEVPIAILSVGPDRKQTIVRG
ncbi:adenylosuccinate synthase [Porphyromonas endodontalis]|jgi:adenylosuccinate synthase|uniref:Adenylosuccinate synthetase n=2 Tax=Porphyromonas endodontalis TaxID=28124 RepID=C3J885_POREA|nr:adenylosuccinate synthase [Porphyromonas endodontalis]EEN83674.1 adenylosuccinate synthase [Porphyromonas endodontalis ATCC 35406]UBH63837.1 adenylosuccinate synthase [Porphyromonas endodontalis]SUB67915.1 Adenylosuccinate synthetase [Porphyromonas endodontalis]